MAFWQRMEIHFVEFSIKINVIFGHTTISSRNEKFVKKAQRKSGIVMTPITAGMLTQNSNKNIRCVTISHCLSSISPQTVRTNSQVNHIFNLL